MEALYIEVEGYIIKSPDARHGECKVIYDRSNTFTKQFRLPYPTLLRLCVFGAIIALENVKKYSYYKEGCEIIIGVKNQMLVDIINDYYAKWERCGWPREQLYNKSLLTRLYKNINLYKVTVICLGKPDENECLDDLSINPLKENVSTDAAEAHKNLADMQLKVQDLKRLQESRPPNTRKFKRSTEVKKRLKNIKRGKKS